MHFLILSITKKNRHSESILSYKATKYVVVMELWILQ